MGVDYLRKDIEYYCFYAWISDGSLGEENLATKF